MNSDHDWMILPVMVAVLIGCLIALFIIGGITAVAGALLGGLLILGAFMIRLFLS